MRGGLSDSSLFTNVGAKRFDARADHAAAANPTYGAMLPVVGCVVLVLVLVMLAVAGACCCWFRCCHDTATRERQESLPRCDSVSETAVVTNPGSSARL